MALAEGFVEQDGGGSGSVEGFDLTFERDVDAGVRGVNDVFGKAGAFVAHEKRDRLTPVDFPGSSQCVGGVVVVDAGRDGGDVVQLELSEQDAEGGAVDERKVERGSGGGAEGLRGKWTGGAGLAGGGSDGSGGAEGGSGTENGTDVAGILHTGEDDDQWGALAFRGGEQIFELRYAGNDEGADALRVLGVGDACKKAIGGGEDRESDFGAGDERSEVGTVAFAGFAEQDCFDFAAGGEGFFDKAEAFDADRAGFGGEAAAEGHAKQFQPAIVAAHDRCRSGFCRRGHLREA